MYKAEATPDLENAIVAGNVQGAATGTSTPSDLFGFFVGQVMKAMAGKANPQMVNERLRAKLG